MPNKLDLSQPFPEITKSDELYGRAVGLIPGVTQTLAKGPGQYVRGVAPKYLVKGKGSHVWDADGNEFLDLTMAVGPLSLGYCYEKVDNAIRAQLEEGITFSMMHPLEVEVAELISQMIPNAECVRFSKTGADVTSAAIRLARAYTGKNKILCCGYHGWHDWYIGITDRNNGVPQCVQDMTHTFTYNDMSSVFDSIDDDTACVILEPMVFEEPRNNFLHELSCACSATGTVLIFDEMWTGFRLANGGAQEYFSILADLSCYSKALANGMPLSVLAGKREIMELLEKDVFFFTTFGGEALSLAAACATLTEIRDRNVPAYLTRQGERLRAGYNERAEALGMDYTRCKGHPSRTIITFDAAAADPLAMKSLMQQEMIKRGVLWSGFHNLCLSHSDQDINYALDVYEAVLPIVHQAVREQRVKECLRGVAVEPVFRKTGNFDMKPVRRRL
ncbi:MAG TPA: aspartate aminotransferase family protein [Nitrospiraceae bacterium]|jgi:glutamate-1-semialdehyde aminotransferase|nr:aspartate aminotransferase family protein [Nitrospiraceae bacterium]